jgi:Leucine rich repeat
MSSSRPNESNVNTQSGSTGSSDDETNETKELQTCPPLLDSLNRRDQLDSLNGVVVAATANTRTTSGSGGHVETTSNPNNTAPYTLPSGDLMNAKNTMRSYSVDAAAGMAVAGVATTTPPTTGAACANPAATASAHSDNGEMTYKMTMQSSSFHAVTVPTRHEPFVPPSNAAAPFPPVQVQEPMPMAMVVPDSVLHATHGSSNRNHQQPAVAVALAAHWSKPLVVILGVIAVLLLVIAVIGGVCATGGCFSSSSAAGSTATARPVSSGAVTVSPAVPPPTPSTQIATPAPLIVTSANAPRAEQVVAFINDITLTGQTMSVSASSIMNELEPEELALYWLIYNDTDLNLWPDSPTNRFRLQQRYALAILQVQGDDIDPLFGIVGNECEWNGVTCKSQDELGILEAVTEVYIDTYNNGTLWTGRLSADLGLLSTLLHFNMSGGEVGGSGGLVGTLPSQFGLLKNLQALDLSYNKLTGSLPSQIGLLTNLTYLRVSANELNGSLPSQIGQLTNLAYFRVSSNDLTGILPSQIWQLTSLQSFGVSSNQLTGSLPYQIGQLTNLTSLFVYDNELTGSLPSQIGQLTNLRELYMNTNNLTGSLPNQLGQLTSLRYLILYYNNFIGTIPESVCLLRNESLTFLTADCISDVSCEENCCTYCT